MNETIVSRFFDNASRFENRVLYRYVENTLVREVAWEDAARRARGFAAGLITIGHMPGDRVAIISRTRHEWGCCDLANLMIRGITVAVYPSLEPEPVRDILSHCDARVLIVEDPSLWALLDRFRARLPRLETVILIEGGVSGAPEGTITFGELVERGEANESALEEVERRRAELNANDYATFVYTSGTTGDPKAAMITHGNIVAAMKAMRFLDIEPDDQLYSFLPLTHAAQRFHDYCGIWIGATGFYPRPDRVVEDMIQGRPTMLFTVPRFLNGFYNEWLAESRALPPWRRVWSDLGLKVAFMVSKRQQRGRPLPPLIGLLHRLIRAWACGSVMRRMGGRLRLLVIGGAPTGKPALEFFDACGVAIREAWGMTETFCAGTGYRTGERKFGSIGRALEGVEVKLSEENELLIRGANVMKGYYNNDKATRAAFTEDGFLRTGDIAGIDAEGMYFIVGRKAEIFHTSEGTLIVPPRIEQLLKQNACIAEAMVLGEGRSFVTALIAVTPEANHGGNVERSVGEIIQRINTRLTPGERIRAFRIIPEALTLARGELTPTMKLRRQIVARNHARLIESMYATDQVNVSGQ